MAVAPATKSNSASWTGPLSWETRSGILLSTSPIPSTLPLEQETLINRSIYGDNLEVLAKWFQRTRKRDKIFLASKVGIIMGENLQLKGFDSSAEYCKKACDESLKRLGVDCIDLCKSAI